MKRLKDRLGKAGEVLAVDFLKRKGYKILEQNYRTRWGEIDTIAQDESVLVFVEVKTRRSLKFGAPREAVGISKQHRMSKAALEYLQEKGLFDTACRFDVLAITLPPATQQPQIEHIENAFELSGEYIY